jgi:hypothetical protein
MWEATDCNHHNLTTLPRMSASGTLSYHCDKGNVYIPFMPVVLQELRDRPVNAIAPVDVTFLNKLLDELQHRLDVSCVTWGSHIERLLKNLKCRQMLCIKLYCDITICLITINF